MLVLLLGNFVSVLVLGRSFSVVTSESDLVKLPSGNFVSVLVLVLLPVNFEAQKPL